MSSSKGNVGGKGKPRGVNEKSYILENKRASTAGGGGSAKVILNNSLLF